MPTNYYDEPDDQQDALKGEPKEKGPGSTVLLPKTALMGKSVEIGDTITVKVARIMDDEIAVSVGGASASEEKESEPEEVEETPERGVDEGEMKAGDALYE